MNLRYFNEFKKGQGTIHCINTIPITGENAGGSAINLAVSLETFYVLFPSEQKRR